jgi:thiamine biosynthesis lipoprotein
MRIFMCAWLAAAGGIAGSASASGLERYSDTQPHMGVLVTIVLYAPDRNTANRGFEAAFARFEQLDGVFSDYASSSEAMQLSSAAPMERGKAVSDDLWQVLLRAQDLSRRTGGAFDVTVGPVTKLWRRARRRREMPPEDRLLEARGAVGYAHVELDDRQRTVRLTRANMRLDFGGIAKGYAADEALRVLRKMEIHAALVNASGDIAVADAPPNSKGWKIGIAPLKAEGPPSRFLYMKNAGIATSGDAFQYVEIDGRRYSHIVDPRTGLGLSTRSSVTVIAPRGMQADGVASAVSVLGPREGIALAEKMCGVFALVVVAEGDKVRTHTSAGFPASEATVEGERRPD